ncbi:DUF4142 domain-containing protein [Altericroceibacterium xinjiangense]|uniref:DUF4142 domain-containing protein n=1 Tax=Altericroceibacterium xinjiangense TaxID=762261 RepID=UPI0013DEE126|nr:DUF4142 domain-containing protein [Altericroceibacterium xinjiangense]
MAHKDNESGLEQAAHKVMDTVGGMMGKAGAYLTDSAEGFVTNAAISDMYEIEAARIAQQRSTSPVVLQVAERMIRDHTDTTLKLQDAVARSAKVGPEAIPNELDSRRASLVRHLLDSPADSFDKMYLDQQTLAHEEAVTLVTHYRDQGDDPVLRAHAAEAVPIFESHLQNIKQIER